MGRCFRDRIDLRGWMHPCCAKRRQSIFRSSHFLLTFGSLGASPGIECIGNPYHFDHRFFLIDPSGYFSPAMDVHPIHYRFVDELHLLVSLGP
jgi:hypothetical protein